MNFSSEVEVKTVELPDALEFTVTREDGLAESVLGPVVCLILLWFFWKVAHGGIRILLIFVSISWIASYMASWLHGRETKLRVTNEEMSGEGNLNRTFTTAARYATSDMDSIGYFDGGEGGTGGLYIRRGWSYTCLLPNVNREQADAIVDVIARRFPLLPTEHSSSGHFGSGKLIELGLSKLNRDDADRKD